MPRITQTDVPVQNGVYAINLYDTNDVFTCDGNGELRTHPYDARLKTQQFRCDLSKGHMGFWCLGADDGKGAYLGFTSGDVLICRAKRMDALEYTQFRVRPSGAFELWMKKDDGLRPIAPYGQGFKMLDTTPTFFGFTKVG